MFFQWFWRKRLALHRPHGTNWFCPSESGFLLGNFRLSRWTGANLFILLHMKTSVPFWSYKVQAQGFDTWCTELGHRGQWAEQASGEGRAVGLPHTAKARKKGGLHGLQVNDTLWFAQGTTLCVFLKMQMPGPQHRPNESFQGRWEGECADTCALNTFPWWLSCTIKSENH